MQGKKSTKSGTFLESLDMFAMPIASFNIDGRDKVATKLGVCVSMIIRIVLIFTFVITTIDIMGY